MENSMIFAMTEWGKQSLLASQIPLNLSSQSQREGG
jgi:hypothetical protein